MPICRDLEKLHPVFHQKVAQLIKRVPEAMVWETYRSPERAAFLAGQGVGIARSMHCYGLAADLVHKTYKWSASKAFWDKLGLEAEDLGLVWGGRFSKIDKPHVQAVPVRAQARVRAASPGELDKLVRSVLC